jgi:ADP-dependent phosphofructokinase/glucokinase
MGKELLLGIGNNIDYEIKWDARILENKISEYGITLSELTTDTPITDERVLVISILAYIKNNIGGERFVDDVDIIETFSLNFQKTITLGGTSVRAAIALCKLGYTSALHFVLMNEHVRRLLPGGIEYICSAETENTWPHLIIQYPKGTTINAGDIHITTTHQSRLIFTNDYENTIMRISPQLKDLFECAKVFLLHGFNSMSDTQIVKERMEYLTALFESVPPEKRATIFFEDACYHHGGISDIVNSYLAKYADVWSLNEDELQEYIKQRVDLTNAREVLTAIEKLAKIIPCKTLVVHTRFWALAYGKDAYKYRESLLGGITLATTRFRFGDAFTKADYTATGQLGLENAGEKFSREIETLADGLVCCIPSFFVSEKDVTTVGLGDTFAGGFLPALLNL